MAKRGRKPKPKEQRVLEGNRGNRPLPDSSPTFRIGTTPPGFLDKDAKNEWRRIYPDLAGARILTKMDRSALAAYCVSWSRWKCAEEEIAEFLKKWGTNTYRTSSGAWRPIPQIAISRAAMEDMRRWASELGITPSARTRVSPVKGGEKEVNPLAEFLAGGTISSQPDDISN